MQANQDNPTAQKEPLLTLRGVGKQVEGTVVLRDIDFSIAVGEKIGVVDDRLGSVRVLVRILAGATEPDRGFVQAEGGVSIAYFPAEKPGMIPAEYFLDEWDARVLQECGFSEDDLARNLDTFSEEEKARLSLVRIMSSRADLILIEEPILHLDQGGRARLEQHIKESRSAFLVMSQDIAFLHKATERVLEIEDHTLRVRE